MKNLAETIVKCFEKVGSIEEILKKVNGRSVNGKKKPKKAGFVKNKKVK